MRDLAVVAGVLDPGVRLVVGAGGRDLVDEAVNGRDGTERLPSAATISGAFETRSGFTPATEAFGGSPASIALVLPFVHK